MVATGGGGSCQPNHGGSQTTIPTSSQHPGISYLSEVMKVPGVLIDNTEVKSKTLYTNYTIKLLDFWLITLTLFYCRPLRHPKCLRRRNDELGQSQCVKC